MVRVIAGTFKKKRLKTLDGIATRPTSDRLKETLFNIMQNRIAGSVFLDAFAGSGSIGIEALSRGAAFVAFVESSPKAGEIIRTNIESLKGTLEKQFLVLVAKAENGLKTLIQMDKKFDIVFFDPPYELGEEYPKFLYQLQTGHLLLSSAIVIAEHSRRLPLDDQVGKLSRFRQVIQGDAVLSFYHDYAKDHSDLPGFF